VSETALVAEAAAKSELLWVRPSPGSARPPGPAGPAERAWPAWHIWTGGAAYVVSGPGEQQLPPLAGEVEVILRSKDTWARLVTVRAVAATVGPLDPDWAEIAAALKAKRLNAPDPDVLLARWAAANTITRLTLGAVVEGPGSYDESSGATAPVPTEATTASWAPWHLRGRKNTRRDRRKRSRKQTP
jgi:hypothetical protein